MATKYGTNYNNAFVVAQPLKVDVSKWGGKVRVMYDEIVLDAVLALNDKVYLGKLPKGAVIVDAILSFPDLGTAGVLDLGYEYDDSALTSDPNAFLSGVDGSTAADTVSMSDQANMVGMGVELAGEAKVVLTATTAITASSGTIKCLVTYAID